jgi:multidrug efflux pump subunit AcrA (membrane-fusion protein)
MTSQIGSDLGRSSDALRPVVATPPAAPVTPKRQRLWLLAVLAVLAALVAAVVTGKLPLPGRAGTAATGTANPTAPKTVAVTVAPVAQRAVRRRVQIVGTFFGHDEVTITPKVEGRVARVRRDVGDVVRPGDVLAEIEDTDYRLGVGEAQRALDLELAKLGLTALPPNDFDVRKLPTIVRAASMEQHAASRRDRMRASGRGVSSEEMEQAETELRVAQANHRQAVLEAQTTVATVRHRQAMLETAQQKLKETQVIVPDPSAERLQEDTTRMTGVPATQPRAEYVIAQRMVTEGEMVRAFPSMAAFRLVMDRPLKLMATVPERYSGEVKVGQTTAITVEAFPGQTFQGTVSRVNPTVARASRTFQVEVLVPNEDRQLRAGSFAKAAIQTREDPKALLIPEEALVTFAGVTKVFVVKDNAAKAVPVTPRERIEETTNGRVRVWIEVTGDLAPGVPVVTTGHGPLADGTPVRVREGERATGP